MLLIIVALSLTKVSPTTQLKTQVTTPTCSDRSDIVDYGPFTGLEGTDPYSKYPAENYAFSTCQQKMNLTWNLTGGYGAIANAERSDKLNCTKLQPSDIPIRCKAEGAPSCTPIPLSKTRDCDIDTTRDSSGGLFRSTATCTGKVKCIQKCVPEETPSPNPITPCTENNSCTTPASMTMPMKTTKLGKEYKAEPLTATIVTTASNNAKNAALAAASCNYAKKSMEANIQTGSRCALVGSSPTCVMNPSTPSCSAVVVKAPPTNEGVVQFKGICEYDCNCTWACKLLQTPSPSIVSPPPSSPPSDTPTPPPSNTPTHGTVDSILGHYAPASSSSSTSSSGSTTYEY